LLPTRVHENTDYDSVSSVPKSYQYYIQVAEQQRNREISQFKKKQNSTWLLAAAPIERFLGPKEIQALEDKTNI
jgi:hypothetical protein